MRASVLIVLALTALLVAVIGACGEDFKACYAGDHIGCPCPNGGWGYAACSPAGDYVNVRCVCDGTTPGIDAAVSSSPVDASFDAKLEAGCAIPGTCHSDP